MSNLLIEPDELVRRLDEPDLRIFDCAVYLKPAKTGYRAESGIEGYREQHIPGAAFMDLITAFSDTSSGLGFTLLEVETLAGAAAAAGIGHDNPVVLYSSGHMMWATRAWWMMKYLGHDDVRVLNGGMQSWLAAAHPTQSGESRYSPSSYAARPDSSLFVNLEGMEAASAAGVCTINALSHDLYTGEGDFHYGRRGHIPGSSHLHYDELLDGNAFRPLAQLQQILSARGLLEEQRVVAYCGGGISATIDAFALKLCGHDNVAVYDGSMSEWIRADKPLNTGETP